MLSPVEDEHIHQVKKPHHHHKHDYEGEIEMHHYTHGDVIVDPAHEILAERLEEHLKDEKHAIEADFADKMINYKTKQSGHEFRLFGRTMVSYD